MVIGWWIYALLVGYSQSIKCVHSLGGDILWPIGSRVLRTDNSLGHPPREEGVLPEAHLHNVIVTSA